MSSHCRKIVESAVLEFGVIVNHVSVDVSFDDEQGNVGFLRCRDDWSEPVRGSKFAFFGGYCSRSMDRSQCILIK